MRLSKQQAMQAVQKLKERITGHLGYSVKMVLFGSVARGDFGPESDIDVLILINGPLNRKLEEDLMRLAFDIELEDDVVFGLLIESNDDWQTPLWSAMPIHRVIDEEGVVV